MLLISLLFIPLLGTMSILLGKDTGFSVENIKYLGLTTSILNMSLALIIFILFDFSTNLFQFVKENYKISTTVISYTKIYEIYIKTHYFLMIFNNSLIIASTLDGIPIKFQPSYSSSLQS